MECFILRFSASWNFFSNSLLPWNYNLRHYHRFSNEVSSNFVYILFLTFHVRFLKEWFIQKCSSKLVSKIKLPTSNSIPLRDRKSFYLFFYSKTEKFVDSVILPPFSYSQNHEMRFFWRSSFKFTKIDYFRTNNWF